MTPDRYLAQLPTRANIIQRMTEPRRIYHNLNHAMELAWTSFDPLLSNSDRDFFYLTAFYHDIIYVPGNNDNEKRSLHEFNKDLQDLKLEDFSVITDIQKAISLSADHFQPKAYRQNCRILCFLDFDLLVLSAPPHEYDLYTKKIRLENNYLDDKTWKRLRADWLEKALDVESIYRLNTQEASVLNQKAKENMDREYKKLAI